MSIELRVYDGVRRVAGAEWDRLVGAGSPFLEHAWLASMEEAKCAAGQEGWIPQILTAWRGDALIGAVPLYIKGNSFGEFVYDWAWADLASRLGVAYYPKLVAGIPFSPVSGERLLTEPTLSEGEREELLRLMIRASVALAKELGLSGVHYLFVPEWQAKLLAEEGLMIRFGHQYHWTNEGYGDFDDFLGRFKAKKRTQIKRERRGVYEESGVTVEMLRGTEVDEAVMDHVFRFYHSTCDKFVWGRQYLNREFFRMVHARMPERLLILLARDKGGTPVAGAFTLEKAGRIYGRYWGCDEEIKFLHFEVCCYAPVAHAIEHGMQVMEPGAGGGHKYLRGFEPVKTWSAHWIADPRMRALLDRHLEAERAAVDREIVAMRAQSPLVHPIKADEA